MSKLSSRAYRPRTDLPALVNLLQSLRAAGQAVYPIAADLYEELADPEVQATARLWEAGDHGLVGFVYVSRYNNLVDAFSAALISPVVEEQLIAWAVEAMRRRNREKGETEPLDASALEHDLPRVAFLERHGFERLEESSLLLARSLDQPIPAPRLPEGFTIRPMRGEVELEACVALHRAAFGTENMTIEYRRAIMGAPGYLAELDLVAVAPNGELAAFCLCQVFPDDSPRAGGTREGWTDPIGTHPAYRRLGLAQALILAGMRLLQGRGIDTALLGTSSLNVAMQRAAEAVGFALVSNTLWYSKKTG